jgi:RimJ/RimL family protein N-acetyltransferase
MKVFETPRLVLRWFELEDAVFIVELLNEPGWKQFIGDRGVSDLESARAYLQNSPLASYAQHSFGLYAMESKSDGSLLGMCGLIKRDGLNDVDIGFALLSRHEGQGLAHEAAAATLVYARDVLKLPRVVAITAVDNERSARLLQRLGMTYEQTIQLTSDSEPLHLYGTQLIPAPGNPT